jgi:hypothetical protein
MLVICVIRVIKKINVKKKRLMAKGDKSSLKIYLFMILKLFIARENI